MDCILHLFHAHLLPKQMVEVEDFVTGQITIQRNYNKLVIIFLFKFIYYRTKAETKESGLLNATKTNSIRGIQTGRPWTQ